MGPWYGIAASTGCLLIYHHRQWTTRNCSSHAVGSLRPRAVTEARCMRPARSRACSDEVTTSAFGQSRAISALYRAPRESHPSPSDRFIFFPTPGGQARRTPQSSLKLPSGTHRGAESDLLFRPLGPAFCVLTPRHGRPAAATEAGPSRGVRSMEQPGLALPAAPCITEFGRRRSRYRLPIVGRTSGESKWRSRCPNRG